ncbi:MAG: hypothetical protein GY896_12155 [Gammaproteobacteria bacterium]|nr:hypothetical protein [Gammaproteobacteria bacterium]
MAKEKKMSNPTVADNKSAKVSLEKDNKYFFCICGLSSKQPSCDGSHQGSEFTPLIFHCDAQQRLLPVPV